MLRALEITLTALTSGVSYASSSGNNRLAALQSIDALTEVLDTAPASWWLASCAPFGVIGEGRWNGCGRGEAKKPGNGEGRGDLHVGEAMW